MVDARALRPGLLVRMGVESYQRVWDLQRRLVAARREGLLPDVLLVLQHRPVVTLGRQGQLANLLVSPEWLAEQGFELHHVERAGDVTYHGPGQLVAYAILNLEERRRDVRAYVHSMLGAVLDVLQSYGISGQLGEGHTGVYVEGAEVCAFGARVREWITFHGLAFNVGTDLEHFRLIHPCGQRGKRVASLESLLGRPVAFEEAAQRFVEGFARRFRVELAEWPAEEAFGYNPSPLPLGQEAGRSAAR